MTTWRVRVHDDDREHDGEDGNMVWEFETEAEAQAFYEGIEWTNDSALTVEKPEPVPAPEVTAHCDTCGIETTATDLPRPGSPCNRPVPAPDPYRPPHVETAKQPCPGTYVEGPLPIFTLTALEEIDVTYRIRALNLDEAFEALRFHDDHFFASREEDAGNYFNSSEERYLGVDGDWYYQGDEAEPKIERGTP